MWRKPRPHASAANFTFCLIVFNFIVSDGWLMGLTHKPVTIVYLIDKKEKRQITFAWWQKCEYKQTKGGPKGFPRKHKAHIAAVVLLNVLGCRLTYSEINAWARFSIALHPRKPEGWLGRTAQDDHLHSHTAPELWGTHSDR